MTGRGRSVGFCKKKKAVTIARTMLGDVPPASAGMGIGRDGITLVAEVYLYSTHRSHYVMCDRELFDGPLAS